MAIPKLSIILTCKDKYELLRFAVDSVFCQTYKDWELVIADDNSQDPRVVEYLRTLTKNPKVSVFWGKEVTKSYRKGRKMNAIRTNAAFASTRGEMISYLGDDNVYTQDRCEVMVDALDSNPEAGMVVGMVRWVMFDGREAEQDKWTFKYVEPFEEGHAELLKAIAPSNFIVTDAVVHRRPRKCCWQWPTDSKNHTPVDWRYWLKLHETMGVLKIDHVGARCYFPGTWRHGVTVKQVLPTRRDVRRIEMPNKARLKRKRKQEGKKSAKRKKATDNVGKIWCVNTSGKNQQISDATMNRPLVVLPGGRVEEKHVKTANGIFPGFSYDSHVDAPPLKTVLATPPRQPGSIDYEVMKTGPADEPPLEEMIPKERQKPIPPPVRKGKKTKSVAGEKSPFDPIDDVVEETAGRVCSGCGSPIYAGSKTGLCKRCYNISRRKKKE